MCIGEGKERCHGLFHVRFWVHGVWQSLSQLQRESMRHLKYRLSDALTVTFSTSSFTIYSLDYYHRLPPLSSPLTTHTHLSPLHSL
jgi:hypothetical protein